MRRSIIKLKKREKKKKGGKTLTTKEKMQKMYTENKDLFYVLVVCAIITLLFFIFQNDLVGEDSVVFQRLRRIGEAFFRIPALESHTFQNLQDNPLTILCLSTSLKNK